MIKQSQDKMMKAQDTLQKFFFPEYTVTIEATSQEEALEKLQDITNKK